MVDRINMKAPEWHQLACCGSKKNHRSWDSVTRKPAGRDFGEKEAPAVVAPGAGGHDQSWTRFSVISYLAVTQSSVDFLLCFNGESQRIICIFTPGPELTIVKRKKNMKHFVFLFHSSLIFRKINTYFLSPVHWSLPTYEFITWHTER